jgi:hypothetical protein
MSMSSEETQKLAAALEQLEAEQRRREDERVAAGQAVRVPFGPVVVQPGDDINAVIERLKAGEIEKLRANGETREVIFEEPPEGSVIVTTGVPRSDDFGKWNHEPVLAQYPDRYAATTPAIAPKAKPAPVDPVTLEWKRFHLTVTPPSERDQGMIIEAKYAIAGGELRLAFQGRVYAEQIGLNDDALVAARKLLRSKYGRHGEFYGALRYPPRSIH